MIHLIIILIALFLLGVLFALKKKTLQGQALWYQQVRERGDEWVIRVARKVRRVEDRIFTIIMNFEKKVVGYIKRVGYSTKRRVARWAEKTAERLGE